MTDEDHMTAVLISIIVIMVMASFIAFSIIGYRNWKEELETEFKTRGITVEETSVPNKFLYSKVQDVDSYTFLKKASEQYTNIVYFVNTTSNNNIYYYIIDSDGVLWNLRPYN